MTGPCGSPAFQRGVSRLEHAGGRGNYFRQLPHWLVKRAVAHWHRRHHEPFVLYFRTWELDPSSRASAPPRC